jgi:HEAT repeat protein
LHYSVDEATNCPYIFFTAPWRNIALGFVRHAEQNLDVFTHDDLLAAYDEARGPEDRANALLRLALGSPRELNDDSFDRIVSALEDKGERVRRAAVYATSYTPSALYRPYLRKIAQKDPVKDIRKDAKEMLHAYDDALIGEP